ncbi:MAG: hypothetical protein JSV91_14920 [Phycisphaerales bacterium]|nr:MAG: hypothetical protein JSV91_14920 [Phycisphaerales bacterium]
MCSESASTLGIWSGRVAGVALVVSSFVLAVLGYFILHLLEAMLEKRGPDYPPPSNPVLFCIEQPWWILLAALPAMLCGFFLLRHKPGGRSAWIALGILLLLIPLAMILGCFLAVIAPLYQMQPL